MVNLFKAFTQCLTYPGKQYEESLITTILRRNVECNSHILDIGCGHGRIYKLLRNIKYNNYTGIEINCESVKKNRKSGMLCYTPDEFDVEFQNTSDVKKYDLIIMSHIVEHFLPHELIQFIDKWLNFLKPGGFLLIATPLLTNTFYNDFDHVKPYHPSGFLRFFGNGSEQVQFFSLYKAKMIDIYLTRDSYKHVFNRYVFLTKGEISHHKLPRTTFFYKFLNRFFIFLFVVSFGYIGKPSGWVGLFQIDLRASS